MSNGFATTFLTAKRGFDHSIAKAINEAATRFHQQTGLAPDTIEFHMKFDQAEGDQLDYVVTAAKIDFNVDEVD